MKLTKELASRVITGLNYGNYEMHADEPADGDETLQEWVDALGGLSEEHGPDMVIALAEFVEDCMSAHVLAHEVASFTERTFKWSGRAKGAVLKAYALHDEFDLGDLWSMLDKSGGMDCFNWDEFADSGSSWVNDLHFIEVPTTGSADTVYLFQED